MIEKVEIKLNKIKRKANPKVVGVAIFMILGAITIFSMDMTNNFKRQKQLLQDQYNKAMYEAINYTNDIEVELAKLQITNTKKLTSTTLANIWRESNLAKANLVSLPVNQEDIISASKYLTQVSDFSYSLMNKVIMGDKITDDEYIQIKQIYENSRKFSDVMGKIYDELNTGRLKWDELEKVASKNLKENSNVEEVSNVQKIGKTFQEYEGLIYDGAFSDHILSVKPKYIQDLKNYTIEDAINVINEMFGTKNIEYIKSNGISEGKIDLYEFLVKLKTDKNPRQISITKKGGKLFLMVGEKEVSEEKISIEEAKKRGSDFLKEIGIFDVKDTYYLKSQNMAMINYAAADENIVLYPDLVKVKVALDTGEVYSVEAQGYIYNHIKRKNMKPKISIEEARKKINKNISILSESLAIIPTESKNEILTYEFKGKIDEREFLIYINAITAEEEKILLIINTPGGILTI
ncbi:MAG: germination protein YpeB [Clostridia bacterium]